MAATFGWVYHRRALPEGQRGDRARSLNGWQAIPAVVNLNKEGAPLPGSKLSQATGGKTMVNIADS